jgi:DNA-binding NtrC family response regulator
MAESPSSEDDLVRWQGLFQRSREPLFLLNRQRRVLFANRAWEQLAGVSVGQARGLLCKRYKDFEAGSLKALGSALCPTAEAIGGRISRVRRLVPGVGAVRRWWDIDFFPLQDNQGLLGILGKVTLVADIASPQAGALPEKLLGLRERLAQRHHVDRLASELPALGRVAEQVRLAGQTAASVLIVGDSGAGKLWLARTIHYQGFSRERSFAALDCAALPAVAISAALFSPGGLAKRSSVGTIYLGNVADLPRELQDQVGDWLKEAGAGRPRLIAGLTRPAEDEVKAGRLLEELAFALGTITIHLPPLRERLADLPLLTQWFLERATSAGTRRLTGLTAEARQMLAGYAWPGNLRELYAVLAAACERAKGSTIDAGDLPGYLQHSAAVAELADKPAERQLPLDQLLEQVERRLIVLALRAARGNKSRAAKLLSIWRPRLLRRMKELGIPDE